MAAELELGLDLAPIIARLRDEVPAFRQVGGAVDLALAMQGTVSRPAAFVLPARDVAAENPFGSVAVQHEVGARFGVLIAVDAVQPSRSAKAHDDVLRALRSSVLRALLNWQPYEDADGCEYVEGVLVQLGADSVLWWEDTYGSRYIIRSE